MQITKLLAISTRTTKWLFTEKWVDILASAVAFLELKNVTNFSVNNLGRFLIVNSNVWSQPISLFKNTNYKFRTISKRRLKADYNNAKIFHSWKDEVRNKRLWAGRITRVGAYCQGCIGYILQTLPDVGLWSAVDNKAGWVELGSFSTWHVVGHFGDETEASCILTGERWMLHSETWQQRTASKIACRTLKIRRKLVWRAKKCISFLSAEKIGTEVRLIVCDSSQVWF